MRTVAAAVAAIILGATSTNAAACEGYEFKDARGAGRVRGPDGKWRSLSIEIHAQWLRYEYAHPRAPWGRLVLIGEIASGKAWLFPLAVGGGMIPSEARVRWQTTVGDGLAEFHLPVTTVSRAETAFTPYGEEPVTDAVNGIPCVYARLSFSGPVDPTVCFHDSGMPVIIKNARGERIFELRSIVVAPVHRSRFDRFPTYPVTTKRPKYLGRLTSCGDRTAAPP